MIIKKADIESFGKFSGKSITFKSGFNLITGNNEDGKSTLMAFIKLMFYGNLGKSPDISKNPRRKYSPWNSSQMAGALEFEFEGEHLRLHKEFKKSSASDIISVFSPDLGKQLELSPLEEVGKRFFNMELGEFERSVFFDSFGGFSSEASTDSLAMRIANLSVSGNESISKATVLKRIDAAKEELISKSGKRGLLIEVREQIEKLRHNLFELSQQFEAQQGRRKELSDLKSQIIHLEQTMEAKSIEIKVEKAKKDLKELTVLSETLEQKSELLSLLSQYGLGLTELEDIISRSEVLLLQIPNLSAEQGLSITAEDYNKLLDIENKLFALKNDKDIVEKRLPSMKKAIEKALLKQKKMKLCSVFSGIILFSALLLSLAKMLSDGFQIPLGILTVILATGTLLTPLIYKKIKSSKALDSAREEYEAYVRHLSFFSEDLLNKNFSEINSVYQEIFADCRLSLKNILARFQCGSADEFKAKAVHCLGIAEARKSAEVLKSQFVSEISGISKTTSYESALALFKQIQGLLKKLEGIEEKISFISSVSNIKICDAEHIECIKNQLEAFLANAPTFGAEALDSDSIKEQLAQKRARLSEVESSLSPPIYDEAILLSQLSEAEDREKELAERYESLLVVSEAMETASSEMSKGFGSLLNTKTAQYLSKLTKGKYSDVLISRNLDIEIRSSLSGDYHHWKHLSSGTIDKLYLALRLAATDILAQDTTPLPLFLDDIFAQYDEESCRDALEFLSEYSKTSKSVSQIFFFTCHKHIADMVKEIIPNTNEITL